MVEKKKIAFYTLLSSGHMNVCISLAKALLDNHSDKVDIYFVCDDEWQDRLKEEDDRFKLVKINLQKNEAKERNGNILDTFKVFLTLPNYEKMVGMFEIILSQSNMLHIDTLSGDELRKIKPDFLLCDQIFTLPTMQEYPYAFIVSANPSAFGFKGYPVMGFDHGVDEKEEIEKVFKQFEDLDKKCIKEIEGYFKERNVEISEDTPALNKPISKYFNVYSYPQEVDYFDEEIKKKYNLWQIDGPLLPSRIPKPFDLPKEFKELPGKIIYISLGSLFSAYVEEIQKMVNILDKLDHKYIVSKGPNGDKLKFPSNKFIGENYINQLAVLQVVDLIITHGGNNTFSESFYFGVPQIVTGIMGDQINNQKRAVESGYGYELNLMNYKEDELISTVEKAINNSELKTKLKNISQRIQKENKIERVAAKIVDYVNNL